MGGKVACQEYKEAERETVKSSSELLYLLGEILEENAAIKAWCNTNFNREQKVYIGIDNEDTPKEEETPLLVVYYVERVIGDSQNRISYVAEVGAGLHKKELVQPKLDTHPNLKAYTGLPLVGDFRELAESAVLAASPRIAGKIDVTGETTTRGFYPFFRSNTLMHFEFVRTSRRSL